MIRILGATLIIGASAAIGFSSVRRMQLRVHVLSSLLVSIETIKNEICDRLTPLPELFARLAAETESPVKFLFARLAVQMDELGDMSFYAIWEKAIEKTPDLELTPAEKRTLTDLGRTLGRYDIEEQRVACNYTMRRLETYLQKAEAERRNQGKVHAALSVIAGVFVVIILL